MKTKASRFNQRLKAFYTIFVHNMFGNYCPECQATVCTGRARTVYNELYHNYNYYIKCKACQKTTPAFPTVKEANDNWEIEWARAEDKIILGDSNEKTEL